MFQVLVPLHFSFFLMVPIGVLTKRILWRFFYRLLHHSLWIYIILSICNLLFREYDWCTYIHKVGILVGLSMFVSLTAYCLKKQIWEINLYLTNSSFFIYVYHGMSLTLIMKCLVKYLHPQTNISLVLIYIICPIITIILGLGVYKILTKYLPKFTMLITGGR